MTDDARDRILADLATVNGAGASRTARAEWDGRSGDSLLFDALDFVLSYVAFPSQEAAWAATLWAAHTHFAGHLETTPRLAVVSPEPQCGKTRVLEVCELLCARPYSAVNTSVAAMFRLVESANPTLLFDEADTYFGPRAREHEELRGLINAGHRRGAFAFRCVGDPKHMEVRPFPAFCPIALACIGDLPATIFDRAVILRMRRRRPDERVTPFRQRTAGPAGKAISDRLAGWAGAVGAAVGVAEPELPDWLTDRPADVWEPLIAIADAAGGAWPAWARQAARAIEAERRSGDVSLGIRLLADIHTVAGDDDKVTTGALVERLNGLDEAPWGNLRGKPLDGRGLARRLTRYDIHPKQVWVDGANVRGYEIADFADAFGRYLSVPPVSARTARTASPPEPDLTLLADLADTEERHT